MKKLICLIIITLSLGNCNIDNIKKKTVEQLKIWLSDIADYGNYCGPYNNKKHEFPKPTDSLDRCCRFHDKRWQDVKYDDSGNIDDNYLTCGKGDRAELDSELVLCVSDLDIDPNNWENPPVIINNETQNEANDRALNYGDKLIFLFDICDTE